MDYEKFFNLSDAPFGSSPDERFYYDSPQHSKVIVKLIHVAEAMRGLGILLGDIGTGKTTIARRMLDIMSAKEEFEVAMLVIIHSALQPLWLIKKVAEKLGVEDIKGNVDKDTLISKLYERLVDIYEQNKKAVVMIDEANMLERKDIMEEMRGLLNIEFPEGHLITFLLFGLPELDNNLKLDMPLYERIGMKCRLETLTAESTKGYIQHRLSVVGRSDNIFTDPAVRVIYKFSKGKPRLINTICDNALLEGFLTKKNIIDEAVVEEVVGDLGIM